MNDPLCPKDDAEAVAVFRAQVIGPLLCREISRGELRAQLEVLSKIAVLTPSGMLRTYAVPTLQRWFYAYRRGGLDALRPQGRERGFALELSAELRELLLAVRRDNRSASVPLILRTLEMDGRLEKGAVSEPTLRRLYAAHGLRRTSLREATHSSVRLRWEADAPNALWHADVCHGPSLRIDGVSKPLRIHAILDDASRYVVAIAARKTEREAEMLSLMVEALRLNGKPDACYFDNGPTYVGEALSTTCSRLSIALLHAQPYDPQARGKMERWWRTLREGCLDHLGEMTSYHDVQVRLLSFLSQHYHKAPHSSLMGRSPAEVYETRKRHAVTEEELFDALTVRGRRRVRRDGTLSVAGTDFEIDAGFLATRVVTVARSLAAPTKPPWVEHDGQKYPLHPVDPRKNFRRKRPTKRTARGVDAVPFDPSGALLDRALSRNHKPKKDPS